MQLRVGCHLIFMWLVDHWGNYEGSVASYFACGRSRHCRWPVRGRSRFPCVSLALTEIFNIRLVQVFQTAQNTNDRISAKAPLNFTKSALSDANIDVTIAFDHTKKFQQIFGAALKQNLQQTFTTARVPFAVAELA